MNECHHYQQHDLQICLLCDLESSPCGLVNPLADLLCELPGSLYDLVDPLCELVDMVLVDEVEGFDQDPIVCCQMMTEAAVLVISSYELESKK